ncbi:MAG TPA: zinc ribbon domain-containing protein [Gemmatimonadales bacterium]|nr:zinc ribbon domain-containing protein [Gemmatimonadales bacterium]
MYWEAAAAGLVGLAILWFILYPLLSAEPPKPPAWEPPELLETPRGVALAALKEIEFDRETGKLSDEDYETLKARYTAEALEALRAEESAAGAAGAGAPAASIGSDVEAMIAARTRVIRAGESGKVPGGAPAAAAIACPTCGPRPELDAVYCSACGRRLATGSCHGCGAALVPDGRFCEACGTPVAA